MSVSEVLIIFHYDGDFQLDIIRPVYNGGNQKMRYLPTDITYESLVNEAIEAFNWDSSIQRLSIQYIHHNGRAFSMARNDDDNDVKRMLKAPWNGVNGIYLSLQQSKEPTMCRRRTMEVCAWNVSLNQKIIKY